TPSNRSPRASPLWFFSILFYIFAFRWMWFTPNLDYYPIVPEWNGQLLIDVIVLSIFAGLGWMQLRRQLWRELWSDRRVQEKAINHSLIAGMGLITATIVVWHFEVAFIPGFAVFAFNVMLFVLAIGLIRDGLALGNRYTFWGGMVLLVLGIVTRMLEYDTGLLLKSIVFALCGAGVIAAGLRFERAIKPRILSLPTQEETL
ncbi:MAG: hypothetical protein HC769_28670, partial [Cyanobacteria bacterium CRU_2_1]|nr:hypothetical protein [Cyanobacteria bacterium CRU_2_1]